MKYFILLLLFPLLFSCIIQDTKRQPSKYAVKKPAHAIFFNVIKEGTNSGFKAKLNQVIKTQEKFKKVWNKIDVNFTKKEALPKIDFNKQMLAFVALGEQTSGGYAVKINSVTENKKNIIIDVTEIKPGKTCITTSVMTYPYQLLTLEKTSKSVQFNWIKKVYECKK